MEYGHYEQNGRVFAVTERQTPRHWYNYFYNDHFVAFFSQVGYGEAFAQDDLGRRIPLVKDRMLYLCDKDANAAFSVNGLPLSETYDSYVCRHHLGQSTIHCQKNGLDIEYTLFVPAEGLCECWLVKVKNRRETAARLSLTAFADNAVDGTYQPQGYNTDYGALCPSGQGVMNHFFTKYGDGQTKECFAVLAADAPVISHDARRNAFIGVYGHKDHAQAIEQHNGCSGSDGLGEKLCLALEADCSVAPGEEKTVRFLIGLADALEDADRLHEQAAQMERWLEVLRTRRDAEISGVQFETPDEQLNLALNGFYLYATVMGSRWARVRHNGYRDMTSDTDCLASFNPELARERFKRVLTYQYENGYAPRTFLDGAIRDNNFADCAVWIAFAGDAILRETGDLTLLDETVPFNNGVQATVYQHMLRSVTFFNTFRGPHGLILLWGGDWNDCMNTAGLEKRGESVWLSIAWVRACRMMISIAKLSGHTNDVPMLEQALAQMMTAIQQHGWDGEWYLTAISDAGMPIGSHTNEEGQLFLIPQLWAVLSELDDPERIACAMRQVDEKLDCPLGARISYPAFTHLNAGIGSITQKAAGMHENGGIYLHTMAWKLAVDAMLGREKHVQRDLSQILPWDTSLAPTCGEPYMLYNSYFGDQTGYRYATPGQSWRTASTQWFVKAMILYVYGLQPELDGLHIRPCLSADWKNCSIRKTFRGTVYHISYERTGTRSLKVEGQEWPVDAALPAGKNVKVSVTV